MIWEGVVNQGISKYDSLTNYPCTGCKYQSTAESYDSVGAVEIISYSISIVLIVSTVIWSDTVLSMVDTYGEVCTKYNLYYTSK